jgi:DNA-binding transcriptional LysR family regulator
VDVDIRYTRPDSADLVARLLAPTRLVLVASPAYIAARTAPVSAADLEAHEAILYEAPPQNERWEFRDAAGAVEAVTPKGRMRVNDGAVLRAALLAGIGVGMMPASEVDEDLAAGSLVQLLPHLEVVGPQPGSEGIFAVYQKSPYQTGKLRSFLAFLPEVFAT